MGDDADEAAGSLARTRSRRSQTASSSTRQSALEKLKAARSGQPRNKFEVEEVKNVYDLVDESDYSRRVQDRQRDDWIVDDGTGEYFEDGREIFDDDLFEDDRGDTHHSKKKSKKEKEEIKRKKEVEKSGFHDLRNMLSAMPAKRKVNDPGVSSNIQVSEDELLSNLMNELHQEKKPKNKLNAMPMPFKRKISEPHSASTSFSGLLTNLNLKKEFRQEKKPKISFDEDYNLEKFITKMEVESCESATLNELPLEIDMEDDKIFEISSPQDDCAVTSEINKPETKSMGQTSSTSTTVPSRFYQQDYDLEEVLLPKLEAESYEDEALNELLMEEESDDDKKLNFFLLDMYEEPKNPGCLYLFGKVQASVGQFVSCCVIVKNLTRCVYFLPNQNDPTEEVRCDPVLKEFDEVISSKFRITSFKSRPVLKKYCFESSDVPKSSAYLEVRYSAALPQLPQDLQGETFSKVFGTTVSAMETFLLEKKLKGPSWLQVVKPVEVPNDQHQSWCRFEFNCEVRSVKHHPDASNLSPPPLTLVSLNVLTVNNSSSKKDEIVFVGLAANKRFHIQSATPSNATYQEAFCLLNKPNGEIWPLDVDKITNRRVMKMDSERALLGCLLAKLQQFDPDLFLCHDLNFEMLLIHLLDCKVPHWSRVGRLKRSSHITKANKLIDFKSAIAGRLVCDIKISAMELIRARSYDFPSLAMQVLGKKDDEVEALTGPEIRQSFESSLGLGRFCHWGMRNCRWLIEIINKLQVMPLALQITTIAGNTLSRTLLGGRSERNEYLLLHAFHSKDYIVPDKQVKQFFKKGKVIESVIKKEEVEDEDNTEDISRTKADETEAKGPSYVGGLVLAPKRGFYDNYIVLMDFNSLYPSIIQEFNICFTTSANLDGAEIDDKERGILPEEIRKLVESRKQVKNLMKGENVHNDLMMQYDIRQKALKLTANSMYGCLGFRNSRFYAKELAAMITGKGRDILMRTKDAVEKMGFEVIYGDTDSIMINSSSTDVQKVYQIGNKIKSEVNKLYKLLELEIDGIFRFMLLLKKKKYAALVCNVKPNGSVETTLEMKGLDMVRRDWAPIAANTARLVLNEIMSEQSLDDKIFKICKILNEVSGKLRAGEVVLKELLITKQLTKNPTEYKSAQGLYHVQVALRMNQSGNLSKKFRSADTVSYLFCTNGNPHHISELCSAPKPEADGNGKQDLLKPDPEYYLAQQIHPVVSRICDPIPGLDPARIADALGLDSTNYKRRRMLDDEEEKSLGEQTEAEKYKECERFSVNCSNGDCRNEIIFEDLFKQPNALQNASFNCPKCCKPQSKFFLHNNLVLFIRKFVKRYYKNTYICEEPNCANTERGLPFRLTRGFPLCPCKNGYMFKEYGDSQLYKQLNYLHYSFDMDKQMENPGVKKSTEPLSLELRETMDFLKQEVTRVLLKSGYLEIKLSTLFQDLYPQESRPAAASSYN